MLKKYFYFVVVVVVSCFAFSAKAVEVSYPVSQLGNCASQEECRVFCDNPGNHAVCIDWAESQKILTPQKAKQIKDSEKMRKQAEGEKVEEPVFGPGGCQTPKKCDVYCAVLEHLDECLQYSVENGYMTPEDADAARAERDKKGPGGCSSEEECKVFCDNPDNAEECMNFVVKEGKITREEADFMIEQMKRPENSDGERVEPSKPRPEPELVKIDEKKAVEILKTEGGPGGCKTLDECDKYCRDFSHADECLGFVKKNRLVAQEEIKRMEKMQEKMQEIMTKGGPGGCQTPEECDAYCQQAKHMKECFNFAKKNQMMPPEELKKMEKMQEMMAKGGPGGCRTSEECDAFCHDPKHMEECINFSVKNGTMSEEEARKIKAIEAKIRETEKTLDGEEGRRYKYNPSRKGNGQMPPQGQMMPPSGQMGGPGGCQTPEECGAYCQKPEHAEECSQKPRPSNGNMSPEGEMPFPGGQSPSGQMMPPENQMFPNGQRPEQTMPMMGPSGNEMGGPGGCKTPEECDAYCSKSEHAEECSNFSGNEQMLPQGQGPQGPAGQMSPQGPMYPEGTIPPEGKIPTEGQTPPPAQGPMYPNGNMPPPEGQASPPEGQASPPEGIMYSNGTMPPEGTVPPEGTAPPPEGNYLPPPSPSEEEPPQSFWEGLKRFLGNLISPRGLNQNR